MGRGVLRLGLMGRGSKPGLNGGRVPGQLPHCVLLRVAPVKAHHFLSCDVGPIPGR